MKEQNNLLLNDGTSMPQVGLGVWQASQEEASAAVRHALLSGYRHVDTASVYQNETGVGEGIRSSGIDRKDLFVTTKVWNDMQGSDATVRAFDESLNRLGLDYVDLYLIHWPMPKRDLYVDTWEALIRLREEGRVRAIGVSNFEPEHVTRLVSETGVKPTINQIELHPRFQQQRLRDFHADLGIATQSWSPLGQGTVLSDPVIAGIASKHGRTPAQIVIRWHIDSGLVVIPKSVTPSRIEENLDVFSFQLDADDLGAIASLDAADGRIGPDPMTADF